MKTADQPTCQTTRETAIEKQPPDLTEETANECNEYPCLKGQNKSKVNELPKKRSAANDAVTPDVCRARRIAHARRFRPRKLAMQANV